MYICTCICIHGSSMEDGGLWICDTYLRAVFAAIPNAPITAGIPVVLRCHIFLTSVWLRPFYLLTFSNILSDALVSLGTDTSMRKQVLSLIFYNYSWRISWIAVPVSMLKFYKMVPFLFSVTFGGLFSHQFLPCARYKFLYKHQWMY